MITSSIASSPRPDRLEVRAETRRRRVAHARVDEERPCVAGEHVLGHEADAETRLDAVDAGGDLHLTPLPGRGGCRFVIV